MALWNWTYGMGFSLKELEDTGAGSQGNYKLINYVGGPIQVNYKATWDMLTHLKGTGTTGIDPAVWAAPFRRSLVKQRSPGGYRHRERE
jgi:hypothetical protein